MYEKYYTTAMCPQGKFIEKRFKNIKSAGKIKKYVSVAGIDIAFVIFSAVVFASGILQGSVKDDMQIEIFYQNEKTALKNMPFIKDKEVFLPLRELLNVCGISDENIVWNNGKITLNHTGTDIYGLQSNFDAEISLNEVYCYFKETDENGENNSYFILDNAPVLKNGVTYVPYEFITVLNGETKMADGIYLAAFSEEWSGKFIEEQMRKAIIWAEGLKTRDGKPRYEIMNEGMRERFIEEQKGAANDDGKWYYNIGVSSPWVVNYDIEIIDSIARIVYHQTDSTKMRYNQRELILFENGEDGLNVSEQTVKFEEYERVNHFCNTAADAVKRYEDAMLEGDYRTIIGLMKDEEFDDNGEELWRSVEIENMSILGSDEKEDRAEYELEVNVKKTGLSDFVQGKNICKLLLLKNDNGWFVKSFENTSLNSELKKVVADYLEQEFMREFSPYYDIVDLKISDWKEQGNEAEFFYTMIHKTYNRNPDTVEYIKEAKENGSPYYEQLRKEYLEPKEGNFEFKAVLEQGEVILYANVSPVGKEWERVKVADYIMK